MNPAGRGPVSLAEAYEMIDAWHDSESSQEIHNWLGWTPEQYRAYVERSEIPAPPLSAEA